MITAVATGCACIPMLSKTLMRVCNSFPGKYFPNPNEEVTEPVCIITHIPPKESIPVHTIKRSDTFAISLRPTHPLVNSRKPANVICIAIGNWCTTIFFRVNNSMRNRTTQAETIAIVFTADSTVCKSDMGISHLLFCTVSRSFPNRCPARIAEMMCINQINQGVVEYQNCGPITPKINDGPALLQKPNICCASFLVIVPF